MAALESLNALFRDLPNVGEAFRLVLKLFARAIRSDRRLLELSAGLAGAMWWETAGLGDEFMQEAQDVTQTAFSLIQSLFGTGLPAEFSADDLALLVGRIRMYLA